MPRKRGRSDKEPPGREDWLRVFPPYVRDGVEALYQSLSPEQLDVIDPWLQDIGRTLTADDLLSVLQLVREQFPQPDVRRTICIVGPVNTGKSTLYNALVSEGQERAAVSPVPGSTKTSQSGASGILTVVDTPGADDVEAGGTGTREGHRRRETALASAQKSDFLVMIFDASVGIGQGALAVYQDLLRLRKPYLIALNKMDLVSKHKEQVIRQAAQNLQVDPSVMIPISALEGKGLDRLVAAVIRSDPDLVLTIAEVMPRYRLTLAQRRIVQAATAAGSVNLATSPIPVPFASFIPLSGIQAGLVLSLARIYGYDITPGRAKELLTTFAAGFGARTLFQQLITKVPGAGWALGTAIAAATTLAIGYSATAWFAYGEPLTAQAAREQVETITTEIVNALRGLNRENLNRESLAQILNQVSQRISQRVRKPPKNDAP
jgi:small GTP-binding protein